MKLYEIYDGQCTKLFAEDKIISARTAKEAILEYLKSTNRLYKIRRSGKNDVIFKATPFYEKDGKKYKDGNVVWYKIDN